MADESVPMRERIKGFLLEHPTLGRGGFAVAEWLKAYRSGNKGTFTMQGLLVRLSRLGILASACLDVGANRGEWSKMVRAIYPSTALYLLEPQLEMASTLDAFCERDGAATWMQAGAGAVVETKELTIWPDLAGSTLVQAPEIEIDLERRNVRLVTLNSLIEDGWMPIPDIVKIDVQGFELEVLRGASALLPNSAVFVIETSLIPFFSGAPIFADILGFMSEHGYALYDFAGALRRPLDGALASVDAVFVLENGPLRASNAWE